MEDNGNLICPMIQKPFIFLAIVLLLVSIVFSFSDLFAYDDKTTHPALTDEIVDFYNLSHVDTPLTAEQKEWVVEGAILEDTPPRWINHFYDPIWKNGWSGEHTGWLWERMMQSASYWLLSQYEPASSLSWIRNRGLQSSYALYGGDHTWDRAVEEYRKGNKKEAYRTLGHVLHLIEDASVPDHTRNDTHAHELRWVTGDYGSPYEEYSKQYTRQTIKQLRIAETLIRERQQPPKLSIIDDYLISLAKYSNNHFFSKDTINETGEGDNFKYHYPKIIRDNNIIGYGKDEVEKEFELASVKTSIDIINRIITQSYYLPVNDKERNYEVILDAYFSRLSRQAVLHGAGVIDLFHKQANDPNVKINSTPRLAPLAVSITGEGYRAWNFLSSVVSVVGETLSFFSNLLPAQLAGLINANAQPEGRGMAQTTQRPISEPALQSVTTQPKDEAIIVADPIAYEVLVVPVVQAPSAQDAPQDIAQDMPVDPSVVPLVELVATPAVELTTSDVVNNTATTTAPVYHGSGYVSGVSPDALAVVPLAEEPPISFFAASTTADTTATSTDSAATSTDNTATSTSETVSDAATSTEEVLDTATSTEPEIIDGPPIVINEIAWMGTKAQANDEWIELYNKTNSDIDLAGWALESRNQKFSVALEGVIPAKKYFLLERTATTTTDQLENMVYSSHKGVLVDSGPEANLYLKQGTTTVDHIDFGYWLFANQKEERRSLERVSPYATSTNSYNWKTYSESLMPPFAKDAEDGDLFGTPGAKNSVAGYYTPAESMAQDTVWRKAYSPYYVPPFEISIVNNATLTIEPGVVVKFASGGGMGVYGVLRAEGTVEEPIIFTSFSDDTVDGVDSNQDSSATSPAPADWNTINFYNTATSSVVSYAHMKYGGKVMNRRVVGALTVSGSYPHITDSLFDKNYMASLYIKDGAHPFIARNTIKNTVAPEDTYSEMYYGSGIRIADASSTADIIGNIFEDNRIGISSESATSTPLIVKDNTFARNQKNGEFNRSYGGLNLENTNNQDSERKGGFYIYLVAHDKQVKTLRADAMPYILRSGIIITEGGTLTIEPGVVIKSIANPVVVRGTLKAQGTAENPITFTAFADDSDGYDSDGGSGVLQSGAWENIQFIGATSSDSVLEYVTIRYGGNGRNICPTAYFGGPCMEYKGAVLVQDASPTISHTTLDKNLAISVYVEGDARPIIEYSDFRDTKEAFKNPMTTIGGIGISIGAESAPTLTDNTFTNNNEDVLYRP